MREQTCPNCHQSNRVRTVSAIVAEDERFTTTVTDHRRSTSVGEGFATTALAAGPIPDEYIECIAWQQIFLLNVRKSRRFHVRDHFFHIR